MLLLIPPTTTDLGNFKHTTSPRPPRSPALGRGLISRQIKRLEVSWGRFTYTEWLNYNFESLPPPTRVVIGVLWVAFFKFTKSADERAANAAMDEQIERLQQRLTDLQADE